MKKFFLVLIFIFQANIMGAIPSVEGLFRGANNGEISSEGIRSTFLVTRDLIEGEELIGDALKSFFVDFELYLESEKKINLFLKVFTNNNGDKGELIHLNFVNNFHYEVKNENRDTARLFKSVLNSILLNDSTLIANYLKDKEKNFIENKKVLDSEKVVLIEEYKRKLVINKEMEELKINDEEKVKFKDAMKKSLFKSSEFVQLKRDRKKFYWLVDFENFKARFDVDTHQLRLIQSNIDNSEFQISLNDYLLFNGQHSLPKNTFVKVKENESYRINFLKLKHIRTYKKKNVLKKYNKLKESFVPREGLLLPVFI